VSQATPDSWGALRARVTAAIARREAAFADTASAWARFARAQGWSRDDVEVLWDGLTEDVVRRYAREADPAQGPLARREVLAAMGALRERVLKELELSP
jgi:hypothetical protein